MVFLEVSHMTHHTLHLTGADLNAAHFVAPRNAPAGWLMREAAALASVRRRWRMGSV